MFLFFTHICSCSRFIFHTEKKSHNLLGNNFENITSSDFSDHLFSLADTFISTPGVRTVKDSVSINYLHRLSEEIISKNEIFFKNIKQAKITIVLTDAPLHFSLPKGEIFISTGLIQKYIKHESMLVSVLSYELVRSEHLLYPRYIMIPVGYINLEKIILLGRLGLEEKLEIHKWAHYLTVRSGFDGEYYLSWLQTQNRNTADFILQVGDANLINREESLFKAFIIKSVKNGEEVGARKKSGKDFYVFINRIRDQVL